MPSTTSLSTTDPETDDPFEATTPAAAEASRSAAAHYRAPGWLTRNLMNRSVAWLVRRGVNVWGANLLTVRGRRSGELQVVPVNPLCSGGATWLVAPRGETQWVRNLRAAGVGTLRRGRHQQAWSATEVADDDKVEVLRAYLARWKAEVGVFFDGVDADSADDELAAIAHRHPVFRLTPLPASLAPGAP